MKPETPHQWAKLTATVLWRIFNAIISPVLFAAIQLTAARRSPGLLGNLLILNAGWNVFVLTVRVLVIRDRWIKRGQDKPTP